MALMEWEFDETGSSGGQFMATGKVIEQLRRHLAKNEVDDAVKLYESCVQETVGKQLWEEFTAASVQMKKNIANLFYRSRDYERAAAACEDLEEWNAAARAYAASYKWDKAAACHLNAGDQKKAASMFAKLGDHRKAAEILFKAKDFTSAADQLAKSGDSVGAGQLFMRAGDDEGAARALSQVPSNHPQFVQAVGLLSEVLVKLGRRDLAAQRLAMALPRGQPLQSKMMAEIAYRLGRLMWEQNQVDHARHAFELVLAFDKNYKDTARLYASIEGNQTAPVAPASTGAFRAVKGTPAPSVKGIPPAGATDPFAALDGNPFAPRPDAPRPPAPAETVPVGYVQRMDGYDALKQLPIFQDLTLDEMKALYGVCDQVSFADGDILIEQGHAGEGLFIVRDGSIRVTKIEGGGRQSVLAELPAGKYVGEMSLFDDAPTSARVTAVGAVKALLIRKDRLQQLMFEHERIALHVYQTFVRTLSERLRKQNAKS